MAQEAGRRGANCGRNGFDEDEDARAQGALKIVEGNWVEAKRPSRKKPEV